MTRKDVLNKLRDMGIAPIAQSVLSDFTEIAKWSAAAERERCAKVCEEVIKIYMSRRYTTDPLGGFREKFAKCCAAEIGKMK